MDSSSQQPSTPQGQSRDYRIWTHIKHNVFQDNIKRKKIRYIFIKIYIGVYNQETILK